MIGHATDGGFSRLPKMPLTDFFPKINTPQDHVFRYLGSTYMKMLMQMHDRGTKKFGMEHHHLLFSALNEVSRYGLF